MNPPSIALSPTEVRVITGYTYPNKQIHALAVMDIPFKVRPDGTPFVARAAIEGTSQTATSKPEAILTLI